MMNEKIRIVNYHSFVKMGTIVRKEVKNFNKLKSEMVTREQELGRRQENSEDSFLLRKNKIATKRLIAALRKGLNVPAQI